MPTIDGQMPDGRKTSDHIEAMLRQAEANTARRARRLDRIERELVRIERSQWWRWFWNHPIHALRHRRQHGTRMP